MKDDVTTKGDDMRLSSRIAKNAFSISSAHILCRLLSFVFVLLVARRYGTEEFGQYTFALGFVELFSVLSDLGLSKIMVREVARDRQNASLLIGDMLLIKAAYSVVTFAVVIMTLTVLDYSPDVKLVAIIFLVRTLLDSVSGLIASVYTGYERMEVLVPLNVGQTALSLILGYVFVQLRFGLEMVAVGFAFSSFLALSLSWVVMVKRFARPRWRFDSAALWTLAQRAFPFGLGSIFVRIFIRIDSVILSKAAAMTVVGWYNAAHNLVIVLLFLPGALSEAIYPVLSRFFKSSENELRLTSERYFKYSMMIGLPMSIGIFAISGNLIEAFYGKDYAPAAKALSVMSWILASSFANFVFTTILNSSNREKRVTLIVFICSLLNIGLNFLLIPQWKHLGASVVALGTEAIFVTLAFISLDKRVFSAKALLHCVKPALASAGMYGVMLLLPFESIAMIIPLASLSYVIILLGLRPFDTIDRELLARFTGERLGKYL